MKQQASDQVPQLPPEVAASFFRKRLQVRIKTINNELWEQRKRKTTKRQRGFEEEKHSRAAKRRRLYK
jgi:hypothetical protein